MARAESVLWYVYGGLSWVFPTPFLGVVMLIAIAAVAFFVGVAIGLYVFGSEWAAILLGALCEIWALSKIIE